MIGAIEEKDVLDVTITLASGVEGFSDGLGKGTHKKDGQPNSQRDSCNGS